MKKHILAAALFATSFNAAAVALPEEVCVALKPLAGAVMEARQAGVPEDAAMGLSSVMNIPELAAVSESFVAAAYEVRIMETEAKRKIAIRSFEAMMFALCLAQN